MKLFEYMGRELLEANSIPVPRGFVIDKPEALDNIREINFPVVVKAQVQTGGRGKAGGVKVAGDLKELKTVCGEILNLKIKGLKVNQVMVVEKVKFVNEFYLSIVLDRLQKVPVVIFSPEGGIDIEETARNKPDKVIKIPLDPFSGIEKEMVETLVRKSGIGAGLTAAMQEMLSSLYKVFCKYDCLLAEINPLMVTDKGGLIAADIKVEVDDNALSMRQPEILRYREELKENSLVLEARKFGFLYIPVTDEGNVAVMSNGSGMLMSSIDSLSRKNFKTGSALDIGGGATAERIAHGIRILLSNTKINTLFINIFGGITRCDEVAGGIKTAMSVSVPGKTVIVRMEGTNKDNGLKILESISGNVIPVETLSEGILKLSERGES
jgi:succinyl-CoA synthetase beta subunit